MNKTEPGLWYLVGVMAIGPALIGLYYWIKYRRHLSALDLWILVFGSPFIALTSVVCLPWIFVATIKEACLRLVRKNIEDERFNQTLSKRQNNIDYIVSEMKKHESEVEKMQQDQIREFKKTETGKFFGAKYKQDKRCKIKVIKDKKKAPEP